VIISPHSASAGSMARDLLTARLDENIRRFCASEPLVGEFSRPANA
jgi:hypothetical protein